MDDAYWAKDVQELFRLERRSSFQRFAELLFAQSGGMFEASRFAAPCEVSRQTITNYLAALEATFAVHVVRPYSTHRATEIVSAPKVYGFDTGFVCYHRGFTTLRPDDMGLMWEHFVMGEIHVSATAKSARYWRRQSAAPRLTSYCRAEAIGGRSRYRVQVASGIVRSRLCSRSGTCTHEVRASSWPLT